uniref:Helicase ATP-binding domain-containing protein n=1 Tax=Plectus sambesii TaxID=2011161 RepID=A0A914WHX1_9BILA
MAEGVEAVAVELQEPAEIEGDSATVSVEIEAAVQQIEHIALEEDRRKAAEADRVEMMNKLEKTLNSSVRYKEMLLKKLSNFDEHQRMERARMEEMRKKKAPVKRASSTRKRKASSSPAGSSGSQSRQQSPKTEENTIINTQLPKYFTGGDLREYQIDGYRWLHTLYMNGVNGILADEMGLGKTIQAIAVVCSLYENGFVNERPVFIVAPLSTLGNWMREFQKFAPKIPVMIYHGSGAERWPKLAKFRRVHMLDGVKVCPVVISSYEMVLYDSKKLQQFTFSYFIVDEGQRIKNGN